MVEVTGSTPVGPTTSVPLMPIEPNIPLKEYSIGKLLMALPVTVTLSTFLKVIQWTLRKPLPRISVEEFTSAPLIYSFHRDFYYLHSSGGAQRRGDPRIVWLGYHGFASYFPLLLARWNDLHLFRFRFTKEPRPFVQIVDYLQKHPHTPLAILTDAGGPYNRVRSSLFDLAKASRRPVIALKLKCSRTLAFGNHFIPLPFSRVEVFLSTPIEVEELEKMGKEAATKFLQAKLDEL